VIISIAGNVNFMNVEAGSMHRSRSAVIAAVVALALGGAGLSCGGDGGTPPASVATLTITPGDDAALPVGQTRSLTATTTDANGGTLTGRTIAWSVGGAQAGAVSLNTTTGGAVTVTAATAGTATVTATSEGKSDAVTFTVTGATPTTASVGTNDVSLTFTPPTVTIRVGGTVTFTIGDQHNVDFEDSNLPDMLTLGQDGTVTFPTVGTFRYRCLPHSAGFDQGMVGRVVVVAN